METTTQSTRRAQDILRHEIAAQESRMRIARGAAATARDLRTKLLKDLFRADEVIKEAEAIADESETLIEWLEGMERTLGLATTS